MRKALPIEGGLFQNEREPLEEQNNVITEINKNFTKERGKQTGHNGNKHVQTGKDKAYRRKATLLILGITLVIAGLIIVLTKYYQNWLLNPERAVQQYNSILTDSEKEMWRTQEKSDVLYALMNQKISISSDSSRAELRIVNPPYNKYAEFVQIYLVNDPEDIIYQSDAIEPGNIVDYADLNQKLEEGEQEAIAVFSFLQGQDTISTKPVAITFYVENSGG
jgi:uncharacterized membrane protein